MTSIVEDTYAEAFRSLYVEFLITARDRKWLDHAVNAATGCASSSIRCDCEAGLDRYVGPGGDESFPHAGWSSRCHLPVACAAVLEAPRRRSGKSSADTDQSKRIDLPDGTLLFARTIQSPTIVWVESWRFSETASSESKIDSADECGCCLRWEENSVSIAASAITMELWAAICGLWRHPKTLRWKPLSVRWKRVSKCPV